eukprot:6201233-Pleurochrysis_carterae.AAC.1
MKASWVEQSRKREVEVEDMGVNVKTEVQVVHVAWCVVRGAWCVVRVCLGARGAQSVDDGVARGARLCFEPGGGVRPPPRNGSEAGRAGCKGARPGVGLGRRQGERGVSTT